MKLYRSRRDKKLFGLCGGLAESFHVDATVLRVIVIFTAFFSAGTVIFLYLLACLVIPKEPSFGYDFPNAAGGYAPHEPFGRRKADSHLDEMMQDIEKKAMWKEIEELKAKLAKYEKGEK
jgi:phage shock protein PspC (stress-responsive transcriptional regulator)